MLLSIVTKRSFHVKWFTFLIGGRHKTARTRDMYPGEHAARLITNPYTRLLSMSVSMRQIVGIAKTNCDPKVPYFPRGSNGSLD
jgi:hypothetical protein